MKTRRESEIATALMQTGKMIHRGNLNCTPEAEYGIDGRRCDVKFDTPNGVLFLEIFGGKDLSYIRNRLMLRDSRIFNNRMPKKNTQTMHLICNDQANAAFHDPNRSLSLVETRLVSVSEELDHYVNHIVRVLPTNPTKVQYREVAMEILSNLGF